MEPSKQDISTGSGAEPILAEKQNTAGKSKRAPAPTVSASTRAGQLLSLLQSDFFDLSQSGLKITVISKDGKIAVLLDYPGHVLGKNMLDSITLDGVDVNEIG